MLGTVRVPSSLGQASTAEGPSLLTRLNQTASHDGEGPSLVYIDSKSMGTYSEKAQDGRNMSHPIYLLKKRGQKSTVHGLDPA